MHSCTLVDFNVHTSYNIKYVLILLKHIIVLSLQRRLMKVGHVLSTEWPIPIAISSSYCSPELISTGNSLTLPSLPTRVPRSLLLHQTFAPSTSLLLTTPSCPRRPPVSMIIVRACTRFGGKHGCILVSLRPAVCERCTSYSVPTRSLLPSDKSHLSLTL